MIRSVFEKTLVRAGEIRSFHICMGPTGWEVSKQDNEKVAWQHHHADWHQVERTLSRFTREIDELRLEGWSES